MTSPDAHEPTLPTVRKSEFSNAEIGALAHLYRGEVYRSTVWRTRLDSSTNWAVVTTGIALSATAALRHHPCPWCSSVYWSACSFCSKHAATVISMSGGHARVYSKRISTHP